MRWIQRKRRKHPENSLNSMLPFWSQSVRWNSNAHRCGNRRGPYLRQQQNEETNNNSNSDNNSENNNSNNNSDDDDNNNSDDDDDDDDNNSDDDRNPNHNQQ